MIARLAVGLTAAALVVAAWALADGSEEGSAAGERPNIVVVMTDDQDAASVGAMPEVNELLAAEGVTFENRPMTGSRSRPAGTSGTAPWATTRSTASPTSP